MNTPLTRSCVARLLKGSHSFICTQTNICENQGSSSISVQDPKKVKESHKKSIKGVIFRFFGLKPLLRGLMPNCVVGCLPELITCATYLQNYKSDQDQILGLSRRPTLLDFVRSVILHRSIEHGCRPPCRKVNITSYLRRGLSIATKFYSNARWYDHEYTQVKYWNGSRISIWCFPP